jgi:pimeloyl-ACP methyl ester carboxylesterase
MIPIVLVHGGGLDGRCWDPLLPLLAGPALAVDLPGRGAHPTPLHSVTFAACAASVRDDVDAAGFDEVVLVGHSLAGCSMPAILGMLGDRVRHAVFVACTVPSDGNSAYDMLDPAIQERIRDAGGIEPRPMDPEMAKLVLGNDLTDEQFAWCVDRLVAEAPQLTTEPVDLSPLRSDLPRTWVRTLNDIILSADAQLGYAANVGDCPIVDLDAGHMCMVSRPGPLADLLNDIAGGVEAV